MAMLIYSEYIQTESVDCFEKWLVDESLKIRKKQGQDIVVYK